MPGINDSPEQVERILELATENGAGSVSGITLHLRGEVREVFMGWLRSQRPDLVDHYEQLYKRGAYAPKAERERHVKLVRTARQTAGGGAAGGSGRRFPTPRRDPAPPAAGPTRRETTERKPKPRQESLF
jgi:DNA repair photolyase